MTDQVKKALFDQLRELEIQLHQYEIRTDPARLKHLLHPDFKETGYSGKTYNFAAITANLLTEQPPTHKVWSQGYEFMQHAENTVQLIYKSAQLDTEGNLNRHAIRTSIWVKHAVDWQIIYHQGTPTDPFTPE